MFWRLAACLTCITQCTVKDTANRHQRGRCADEKQQQNDAAVQNGQATSSNRKMALSSSETQSSPYMSCADPMRGIPAQIGTAVTQPVASGRFNGDASQMRFARLDDAAALGTLAAGVLPEHRANELRASAEPHAAFGLCCTATRNRKPGSGPVSGRAVSALYDD